MLDQHPVSAKALHQFFARSVQSWSKPLAKNFWLLTRVLLVGESSILTKLVRLFSEHGVIRKVVEKFGRCLEKIPAEALRHHLMLHKHRHAIRSHTIVAVDMTDISKLHTEKQPWVSHVHDGSTGDIGPGCPVFGSAYIDDNGTTHLLHLEAFSRNATTYKSDNTIWEAFMDELFDMLGPDTGIYVLDCGFDGTFFFTWLIENDVSFCVRLNLGNDRLVYLEDGEHVSISAIGFPPETPVVRKQAGKKKQALLLTACPVRLTKNGTLLNVVKITRTVHAKQQSMYLITTFGTATAEEMVYVYETYLKRWKIEEAFRMVKQTFQLENVQLRKFLRFQNFLRLIACLQNFLAWLETTHAEDRSSPLYHAVKSIYRFEQHISWQRAFIFWCKHCWHFPSALLQHPKTDPSALTLFTLRPLPF